MYVSVITKGGIGNILFQVAAGYAYAKRYNKQFVLSREMHQPSKHETIDSFSSLLDFPQKTIEYDHLWCEPSFDYYEIPNLPGNVLLSGYFQSEKYFADYSEEIRNWLPVKEKSGGFIHIRRGDYLNHPDYHTNLKLSYYIEAINYLGDHRKYTILSDDIDWCKTRFYGHRFDFLDSSALPCLQKMASCTYGVIANSTFSWWGAFFSNGEIVAPKDWFGPQGPKTHDLYREEWKLI